MSVSKRLLTLSLVLAMLVSFVSVSHAQSVIDIKSAEEFLSMTTGNYELIVDIDLGNTEYSGAVIDSFGGTLNGNGHTVTGVNVKASGEGDLYAGLFGTVSGTVKNLFVKGSVSADALSAGAYVYAGGIAAVNIGNVDNCGTDMTVSVNGGSYVYAGGISGTNYLNKKMGTVSSCYSNGKVSVTGEENGVEFAGGISGAYGTLSGCVNSSEVALDCKTSVRSYGGGIAGFDSAVKQSVNNQTVSVQGGSQAYAGGIVAFLDAASNTIVQTSVNHGDVTSSIASDSEDGISAAGGICGYLASPFDFTEEGEVIADACTSWVRNCVNNGGASARGFEGSEQYSGGIAGAVNGWVYNCVNTYTGAFEGGSNGPIFGALNPADILRGTVNNCYTVQTDKIYAPYLGTADTVAKVTTLREAELADKASYDGFDFENTWTAEGDGVSLILPAHTHLNFSEYVRGTCLSDDYIILTCKLCGNVENDIQEGSAAGHDPVGNWLSDEKEHWRVCDNPGCTDKVELAAHTFGDYVSDNNATDKSDGTKTAICSVCGCRDTVVDEGSMLPASPVFEFADVEKGKWYEEYAYYAAENGLMTGTSDTTFEPNTKLDRRTFVTILAKVEGVYDSLDKNAKTAFTDVKTGAWFSGAVAWAVEVGVTSGTSAVTFEPTAPITREQMCTMLVRYAEYKEIEFNTTVNAKEVFKDDNKIANYAKESVYICQTAGIVNGLGDGNFGPKDTATRGQAAKIFSEFHKAYLVK